MRTESLRPYDRLVFFFLVHLAVRRLVWVTTERSPSRCNASPSSMKNRAAERQVAQVILKGSKTGDCLALNAERRHTVRDHLFGFRDDLENRAAQCLERAALRLLNTSQVRVNVRDRHQRRV
jgi:hypothetical protein